MAETKFLGRMRVHAGQSLFALNLQTGEITNMGKPKKVVTEQGMVYRIALNKKSFVKKLVREGILAQSKEVTTDKTE